MHRITLGNFELTAISDGIYDLDGGAFFGVVPKTLWGKKVTADANNHVPAGLNSVVVQTADHTVLIETGIGNKMPDRMVKIYGQPAKLLDNLSAAGFSPDDFDIVINTHLHFDHCGWNTIRKGDKFVATFPNAKYYVQEGEWQHGRRQLERDAISYISENYDPLIKTGQMKLLAGDQEIVPGISVKVFPGHTRNMQAVIIAGNGQTACYISDLIPTIAHLDLTWVMAFDLFPLETIESRKQYYSRAIPEKWLTIFTHDPQTPWTYVENDGKGKMIARGI
ncbi:MAG: MBL fold metallo-hydrolase [Acidobacteriaceae bacterium]|nr:MBL fold metallo-hydrolase [Acidobacteriaceae bacterium]